MKRERPCQSFAVIIYSDITQFPKTFRSHSPPKVIKTAISQTEPTFSSRLIVYQSMSYKINEKKILVETTTN